MIELLKLCGYEDDEIKKELPRVEKALIRLGIGPADIEKGKQRLNTYYDMELKGVRKVFRLILKEFVDSMLARDEGKKKLLYGFMAPGFEMISPAVMFASREAYSVYHFWALFTIAGCIFDKMVPILEAAEKQWLKAGIVAHCGNVKTLIGIFALDLFPKPDLLVTSGSLCETAPKSLDLLHEYYGIPVHYFETCQDREFREYSDASKRIIDLEAKSLKSLFRRIEDIMGFELTDKMLRDSINSRNDLNKAVGRMRDLILQGDPLPLSPTHESLWMCLNALTLSSEDCRAATEAIETLCVELQQRIKEGKGVVAKGSPRIISMCPAHHVDPRLEHLLCELDIAMIATDMIFSAPSSANLESPEMMIASNLQGSLFTSPAERIRLIVEGSRRLKIDGLFDRYHVGCRTSVGDALIIKEAVEKEAGIPVLVFEWENFDPRYFNYEQCSKKLQAFKGMMLSKRGST
ncbi:MAG: 2-hydroxyacyl-CoA dehydratase [Dehalococcoidales bacterium]|nr:2-hydroxyacyl-CoA dehydratase [Dehalococcoidales bacterium]